MRLEIVVLTSVLLLLLSSCLTVDSNPTILEGGRGRLSLNYQMSKQAVGLQRDSSAYGYLIPLPVSETLFQERSNSLSGITINSLNSSEDLNHISIQANINFDSIQDLSRFLGIPMEMEQTSETTRLAIFLFDQDEPVSQETREMVESLSREDILFFSVIVPGSIVSTTYGDVTSGQRRVTHSLPLSELFDRTSYIWNLEWQ